MFTYLKNTEIVCLICILAQIIISCLTAYGFVFFRFPGKIFLFTLVLMTTMIPGEVVVITNYMTIQKLDLINTYAGLVLPSLTSGTSIFLMRQYFLALPKEYKEAATIDGCGEIGYLFRVACRWLFRPLPHWPSTCLCRSTINSSGLFWSRTKMRCARSK